MTKKQNVICFKAQVWQVKTLVDGGINLTLSLSDKEIEQVSKLLECKQRGAILEIAAVPVIYKVKEDHDEEKADSGRQPTKRTERYPYHTNA